MGFWMIFTNLIVSVWVLIGMAMGLDAAAEMWATGEFRRGWSRVQGAVRRGIVLPVAARLRPVRSSVVLRVRLVGIELRKRWGFLRAAFVMTRVFVPVWMVRYQVWERTGAVVWRVGFPDVGVRIMNVGR